MYREFDAMERAAMAYAADRQHVVLEGNFNGHHVKITTISSMINRGMATGDVYKLQYKLDGKVTAAAKVGEAVKASKENPVLAAAERVAAVIRVMKMTHGRSDILVEFSGAERAALRISDIETLVNHLKETAA